MKEICRFGLAVLVGVMAVAGFRCDANAQVKSLKQELVGTWTMVSITAVKEDGTRIEEFGSNPLGIIIFAPDGRFAEILSRSDLPKFASNNRTTGTPEENQAIVRGVYALFGTYTVNDRDRTFTWHIIGGTFPNWNGTDQKRLERITLNWNRGAIQERVNPLGQTMESVFSQAEHALVTHLTDDELEWTVLARPAGGGRSVDIVWKRAK